MLREMLDSKRSGKFMGLKLAELYLENLECCNTKRFVVEFGAA